MTEKPNEKKNYEHLKKFEDGIWSCSGIGDCREGYRPEIGKWGTCPVYQHVEGNFEPFTARGRLRILQGIIEGTLEPSKELADTWFQCTVCGACQAICHQSGDPSIKWFICNYIDHTAIWEAFRRELVELGLAVERHSEIIESCEKYHNPYLEEHAKRIDWIPKGKEIPKKAENILFMGCTEPYREPEILQDLVEILDAANVDYAILHPEEWCCGSVALRSGHGKLAMELAVHNMNAFKEAGARRIITHCSGCYRTMKIDYPLIEGGFDLEVLHVTEFIKKLLEEGKLKLTKSINETVTYHDPCHLGRHTGIYDAPRDILKQIGLKLAEMPRNKDSAWCCGAGGGVKSAFPELAVDIAKERIEEANSIGVNTLVTACPFCVRNLKDAASELGDKEFEVLDLLQILKRAI